MVALKNMEMGVPAMAYEHPRGFMCVRDGQKGALSMQVQDSTTMTATQTHGCVALEMTRWA